MQTLTIGAYRATLAPTRDVGAFQAKLAKCNGKSRRLPLRDLRTKSGFPVFTPGMSTAEYVKAYSSGDGTQLKAWEWAQLNDAPCTLYSGEDTCETLPDGFATWEDFDAAQRSSTAAEIAPDDAESIDAAEPAAPDDAMAPARAEPYPGCDLAAAVVYRAHLATAAHSRAIDPAFSGMLRRPKSPGFLDDFAAPDVRAHRLAIARSVRAERAARAMPCDPVPTHSQATPIADPLATHSALVAEINAMSPVDAFDYLADYTTARERHMTDAEKAPDAMRAAVLADVERTGEAVFWARRRGEPDDDGPTASPPATHSEPAPVPGKSEPETVMLQHVLGALQRIAPDGIPDSAMLAREADRIEATAELMRDAMPDYSATCATAARDLRALADSTSDPLPGKSEPEALDDDETIPAPLDGLDVEELGEDGPAEFERATREQATAPAYRELTTAHYRPQGPCLRIPAFDARAMIPQRFAPVYLLQS